MTAPQQPAISSLDELRASVQFVEANDPEFENATFVISHSVAQALCSVAKVYAAEVEAYGKSRHTLAIRRDGEKA